MRNYYTNAALLAGLLFLLGCQSTRISWAKDEEDAEKGNALERKTEPYDLFSLQRSYPDRDFDWQGWRSAIQQTRRMESAEAAERSNCPGESIEWTLQGASNVAGRVNSLAVQPNNEMTLLAGFSGGGIFKTTDGGINWRPVFDDQPELSIGDITYDPSNPNIVYAGTGDPNVPSVVFNGNGIYKSTDAGETWAYLGLGLQGIISKVLIDPGNSQTLFAAVMGNPYVRDVQRGIYKSTDGGANWTKVLFVSNQAGASDLVMNPANPQILYASFWDRIRNNQESVIYGTHAKVYKTTDGGTTWTQLSGGLPTGVMGRTGLAISPQNPEKLYAIYVDSLSTVGGLFKTTDGGQNWTQMNTNAIDDAFSDFGWYFGKVRINPTNDEEVYILGVLLWRKAAGSNAWQVGAGAHADTHDLVFVSSGRRYLATDGGVYRNDVNQIPWTKSKNLPTTQFYRTNFNPHTPDVYWAGAQDNGIQTGNSQNINNWISVFSADGFRSLFHPTDSNTFWVEIQNGTIHKTTDGGDSWQFGQAALGTGDRCNWDMPVFNSKHNPDVFYAATYRVYSSIGGSGWTPISTDLTDGVIYGDRFHNISALAESPVLAGKLFVGTSDGNLCWRDTDNEWYIITTNVLPNRYVTSVSGSPTNANRFYVTHSGFRDNENIPHVHRSDNNGVAWVDISGNLPQVPVNDLFVLPGHADSILFAATDAGVYFSLNSGAIWNRLGSNMPYIPVFDLEHNPVKNQLIAATHARGLWTIPIDSFLQLQTPPLVSVSGHIRTDADNGVALVDVATTTTGNDGNYAVPNVSACQTFTLKPYRNDNLLNGVSTFDLALISKHILGIDILPTPYRIIAADVNKSNSVTTFDIVKLRKLILGVDSVLLENTSWRFIPADFVFPDPQNPFTVAPFPDSADVVLQGSPAGGINFVGLKVGDVNGSAAPSAQQPDIEDRSDWPLAVQNQTFGAGERVCADFTGEWLNAAGLQFTLHFDPGVLAFEKIEVLNPDLSQDNFAINRTQNGLLGFAFENAFADTRPSGNLPIFRVVFRSKTKSDLRQALVLQDWPTPSWYFKPDGAAQKPYLRFEEAGTAASEGAHPNPFGSSGTWLRFPAGIGTAGVFELQDAQGRLLLRKNLSKEELGDTLYLPASIFSEHGLYVWRLVAGQKTISGKLIYQ